MSQRLEQVVDVGGIAGLWPQCGPKASFTSLPSRPSVVRSTSSAYTPCAPCHLLASAQGVPAIRTVPFECPPLVLIPHVEGVRPYRLGLKSHTHFVPLVDSFEYIPLSWKSLLLKAWSCDQGSHIDKLQLIVLHRMWLSWVLINLWGHLKIFWKNKWIVLPEWMLVERSRRRFLIRQGSLSRRTGPI